jgi:hypothetical protein
MKKLIVLVAVALALPTSVALAKGSPGTHGKSAPKVMYVLKGTLSNYIAPTATTDGSITIDVSHSNYHGRALRNGPPLTFTVTAKTRFNWQNGTTAASVTDPATAKGMVKFRAPKRFAAGTDLATALPTTAKAFHVIVQRPSS